MSVPEAVTGPSENLAQELLGRPYGQLTPVQKSVIDLICAEAPSDIAEVMQLDDRTYWQKVADSVAAVGGSWGFIFWFLAILVAWILGNALVLGHFFGRPFDPYPFIFLNLMLSMIAALQAPVIMMSQNRAAAKDRKQAEHDYMVNLRAELEIMHLHDKVDALLARAIEERIDVQTAALSKLRDEVTQLRQDRALKVE